MAEKHEKNFLSGAEICTIMETCAKNGVYTLKCGPLELTFHKPPESPKTAPEPTNSVTNPQDIIEVMKKTEQSSLEKEEILTREEQIAELMLTDPAKAEELMEQGELVADSEENEDG